MISSIFENAADPFFLSREVNSYTSCSLRQHPETSSQHRRLPYTQKMAKTSSSRVFGSCSSYVDRYCNDIENRHQGVDCPDGSSSSSFPSEDTLVRHSTITPSFEKLTERTNNKPRKRTFGDPLPVDVTQGGYSELQQSATLRTPSPSGEKGEFLTPPSGMASSSSDFFTSSSSRCVYL